MPPSYTPLEADAAAARPGPASETVRPGPGGELRQNVNRFLENVLFDVDDAPMMQKRENVMNLCIAQCFLSLALVTNYRRAPVLIVLQPFFIGAAILGYYGARKSSPLYIAAHFIGSAGLALTFLIFILGETLLKHAQQQNHASADLFFIVIPAPMDIFIMITSAASVILFLSLRQLRRELTVRRQQMRERFEALALGEMPSGGTGAPPSSTYPGGAGGIPAGIAGLQLSDPGAAAEQRRLYALKNDLRCPITLEIMLDPVIASDGHSYERIAIERWLQGHRTSPLTGRVMPSPTLIPNHRLRQLIHDMAGEREVPPSERENPVVTPRRGPVVSGGPLVSERLPSRSTTPPI